MGGRREGGADISLTFLLHLTEHARCTGHLKLGPKLRRSIFFSFRASK